MSRRPDRPVAARAALLGLLLALLPVGSAQGGGLPSPPEPVLYLNPGILTGFVNDRMANRATLGAELSLMRVWSPLGPFIRGVGGFLQVEAVGPADHVRVATGVQGNLTVLLLEVGGYYAQQGQGVADTFGIQLGPVLTLGYVSVGARFGLPLGHAGRLPARPREIGLVVYLKVPFRPAEVAEAHRRKRSERDEAARLPGACQRGDGDACDALAERHLDGRGVARDPTEGFRLKARVCRQAPSALACYQLGSRLSRGDGLRRDAARAAEYFELGCQSGKGHAFACEELAKAYESGSGVVASPARAAQLYERACDRDVDAACFRLGELLEQGSVGPAGSPGPPGAVRAVALFRKACDRGHPPACARLGGKPLAP